MMNPLNDLTNQRFGKLSVLNRDFANKSKDTPWKCICDCGNTIIAYSKRLRNSTTVECHKCNVDTKRSLIDIEAKHLIGSKFGKLTVIDIDNSGFNKNRIGSNYICLCDCGNQVIVRGYRLKINHTKSCGCISKERIQNNIIPINDIEFKLVPKVYIRNTKNRAKKANIKYSLTEEYLTKLFIEQDKKCKYTKLDLVFRQDTNLVGDNIASLDRIRSSEGYVEGNVQWVCAFINSMKLNMSEEQFIKFCKLVAENN